MKKKSTLQECKASPVEEPVSVPRTQARSHYQLSCGNIREFDQGFLLVTEHNAEINAGFLVVSGSSYVLSSTQDDWKSIPVAVGVGDKCKRVIWQLRDKAVEAC